MEPRESLSAKPENGAGLDAGRDSQSARPVEGRHIDFRPQGRLGKGDRQLVDDVVPFAGEAFVKMGVSARMKPRSLKKSRAAAITS